MNRLRFHSLAAIFLGASLLPASDSPGLIRVREVIASGEKPVRIVAFGDSVTGLYYHSGGRRAYPELLAETLRERHPATEITVHNSGQSGHTTTNGLARIAQTVLVHDPHLVIVMFGLNDVAKGTPDLYRQNLAEIVRKCRAAGAEVILCTPNAVAETPERPVAKVAAFAEILRAVAAELRVPLCDPHAKLEGLRTREPVTWRLSMSDEIHPNLRGHRRLAEAILSRIEGERIALDDEAPVTDPLAFTRAKLQAKQPVKVLAMPPFDAVAGDALRAAFPGASVATIPWPVEGLDRPALQKDAANRVRPLAPDLVVVAVPREAAAKDRGEFIRTQIWIASNSISRGRREWDAVVVHPDVFEGPGGEAESERDTLIRAIVPAQDLALADRVSGDERAAKEILEAWFLKELQP